MAVLNVNAGQPARPATLPAPPPGLETFVAEQEDARVEPEREATILVRLSQLPGLLCQDKFLDAMLEQAGLERLVVTRLIVSRGGCAPDALGEVLLGCEHRDAARKVARHFRSCRWGAAGDGARVGVELLPATRPRRESPACAGRGDFVPGRPWGGWQEFVPGLGDFAPGCDLDSIVPPSRPKALESWAQDEYWWHASAYLEQSCLSKHDPTAPMKVHISDESYEACSASTGCFSAEVSDADPQESATAALNWS